jgi:hypothetical protein
MGDLKAAFVIFYMSQLSIKETDFDSCIVKFQNFLALHMYIAYVYNCISDKDESSIFIPNERDRHQYFKIISFVETRPYIKQIYWYTIHQN